jgi:hypothetical protein
VTPFRPRLGDPIRIAALRFEESNGEVAYAENGWVSGAT